MFALGDRLLLADNSLSQRAAIDPKQPLDVDPFKREGRGAYPMNNYQSYSVLKISVAYDTAR